MKPIPILILGDAPDARGGLSRITRDIAGLLCRSPLYRVGVLGRLAIGSRRLPFAQYAIRQFPGGDWGQYDLPRVWDDFAGKERGVVMTIWDPTRTLWLSRPDASIEPSVRQWLAEGHFDLWGYFPIDATGPGDKLSAIARESLMGYRRVVAYTQWGAGLIERSLGQQEAKARHSTWLPHGLDLDKWQLRDAAEAKARLFPFLHEGDRLIGINATNQPRKDWGLGASVCGLLAQKHPRLRFWWHTDLEERSWSLPALVHDFGLSGKVQVSMELNDEQMSWRYAACDLTLHIGAGEGFGFPIFESLASGVPVLHGDYAGGADVLRQIGWGDDFITCSMLVPPQAWRLEGLFNQVRPVFDSNEWTDRAEVALREGHDPNVLRASVAHLWWKNLWPACWQPWFEQAAREFER